MKSNELFEEIHSGNIKDGTKINVVNEDTGEYITTIEYKNGKLNWTSGEFDTSYLCDINIEFLIEKNKEIEELDVERCSYNAVLRKINELVRAVNKLTKEREAN